MIASSLTTERGPDSNSMWANCGPNLRASPPIVSPHSPNYRVGPQPDAPVERLGDDVNL